MSAFNIVKLLHEQAGVPIEEMSSRSGVAESRLREICLGGEAARDEFLRVVEAQRKAGDVWRALKRSAPA
jgi:hypothetical protein